MDQEDAHLGHVDDDVAGRVNDQHEVVQPGEVVGPGGPVLDSPVLKHLKNRERLGKISDLEFMVREIYFV